MRKLVVVLILVAFVVACCRDGAMPTPHTYTVNGTTVVENK